MTGEHVQYVRISSTDGRNTVESVLNDLEKQASKGRVEFGVDISIERVTLDQIKNSEDYE